MEKSCGLAMDHLTSPDVVSDLIIPERNPCKIYVGNLPFAAKVSFFSVSLVCVGYLGFKVVIPTCKAKWTAYITRPKISNVLFYIVEILRESMCGKIETLIDPEGLHLSPSHRPQLPKLPWRACMVGENCSLIPMLLTWKQLIEQERS